LKKIKKKKKVSRPKKLRLEVADIDGAYLEGSKFWGRALGDTGHP
jgi:hypothetical protein